MGIAHLVAFLFYLVAMSLTSRGIGAKFTTLSPPIGGPPSLAQGRLQKDRDSFGLQAIL